MDIALVDEIPLKMRLVAMGLIEEIVVTDTIPLKMRLVAMGLIEDGVYGEVDRLRILSLGGA